jgi:hypothetical protein
MRRCYFGLLFAFIALLALDLLDQQIKRATPASMPLRDRSHRGESSASALGSRSVEGGRQARKARKAPLQKTMAFGQHGKAPGRFDQPRGLTLVREKFLLVSDFGNKRVQLLAFHHHERAEQGQPVFEYALEVGEQGGPWSLCALGDFVFLAEWGMHRVRILHLDAKLGELRAVGEFGQFGYLDEPGRFNHPRGIAVHVPTGFVIVSDENDHLQVLRFDAAQTPPSLKHVSSFGRPSPSVNRTRLFCAHRLTRSLAPGVTRRWRPRRGARFF